ncbi:hypothetical protein [Clostridium akagii]|uniref:hypothetical protein n=1 Tax=Clostridium akagii TaxID=91623 RepID=UPI00047B9335|nr:hypothetical protein [Clostridium akagii]
MNNIYRILYNLTDFNFLTVGIVLGVLIAIFIVLILYRKKVKWFKVAIILDGIIFLGFILLILFYPYTIGKTYQTERMELDAVEPLPQKEGAIDFISNEKEYESFNTNETKPVKVKKNQYIIVKKITYKPYMKFLLKEDSYNNIINTNDFITLEIGRQ